MCPTLESGLVVVMFVIVNTINEIEKCNKTRETEIKCDQLKQLVFLKTHKLSMKSKKEYRR